MNKNNNRKIEIKFSLYTLLFLILLPLGSCKLIKQLGDTVTNVGNSSLINGIQ